MVNELSDGKWRRHRIKVGAPVAVDGAVTAPDDATPLPNRRALLNAHGFRTVLVGATFVGGTTPTVTLQPLMLDEERDVPGTAGLFVLPDTAALGQDTFEEVTVHEGRVFFRMAAVTGSPTTVEIRVAPGVKAHPGPA